MKMTFLSFIFIIISLQSYCQDGTDKSGNIVSGSNLSIFEVRYFSNIPNRSKSDLITYENIDGSPYIDNYAGANKKLPIGKFYTPEFQYMETALARYNAYTDNMEVSRLEDGIDYSLLTKKPNFLYIILGETKYRAYKTDEGIHYFVILSEHDQTKCTLLKKQSVIFKKAIKAESSFVSGSPDTFQRMRDSYYYKFENGLVEIPNKKKNFFRIFNNKEKDIEKYVDENRLKITKEEDLLNIATYYNSLFK